MADANPTPSRSEVLATLETLVGEAVDNIYKLDILREQVKNLLKQWDDISESDFGPSGFIKLQLRNMLSALESLTHTLEQASIQVDEAISINSPHGPATNQ